MKTTNIVTIQKCRLGIAVAACVSLLSCSNEADLQNTDDNVLFFASVDTSNSRVTESAWDGDELIGIKSGETVKTYKVATDGNYVHRRYSISLGGYRIRNKSLVSSNNGNDKFDRPDYRRKIL